MPTTTLYYVHDPMCSWCWGFATTLKTLLASLPADIEVKRLLGGLAPDTDAPMPEDLQQMIQNTWRRIEQTIPPVKFNFDFWQTCQPRRATYPACRAVIAARQQGDEYDEAMTAAIQHAYYQHARNPSDDSTLIGLAGETGLDAARFKEDFYSAATQQTLMNELEQARTLHADSFPALVLQIDASSWRIPIEYNEVAPMLETIAMLREN